MKWLMVACLAGAPVFAEEPASFALVIGVNQSLDAELPPLRYADDDAARWVELFRALGAQTWLLSRLDANTARLHPQATAEAREPVEANLTAAVTEIAQALERAERSQIPTRLYVVYAGHGNVRDGTGYLMLEDARLTAADLADRLFDRLPATRTHLFADACFSSFLVTARGPGGVVRAVRGFSSGARLAKVGLILSTSSARESHEWEGFQAGVFSHEVRSGLYGAADSNGDGRIEYRELAAFVQRANEGIPNEKFRPDVFAQSAGGDEELIDLRRSLSRRVEIDGAMAGHYLLEDTRGVRLADFHNAPSQQVRLLRPSSAGQLYLRRVSDQSEFTLPAGPPVLSLGRLEPSRPRVNQRGAAHDAFSATFSLPFDANVVSMWRPSPLPVAEVGGQWLRPVGFSGIGLGLAALVTEGVLLTVGVSMRANVGPSASQRSAAETNERLRLLNTVVGGVAIGGALVFVSGVVAYLLAPHEGGGW